jgi:hypothetical protein
VQTTLKAKHHEEASTEYANILHCQRCRYLMLHQFAFGRLRARRPARNRLQSRCAGSDEHRRRLPQRLLGDANEDEGIS